MKQKLLITTLAVFISITLTANSMAAEQQPMTPHKESQTYPKLALSTPIMD
jgi:hypothetical protein